jgi:hypothetical protein
MRIKNTDSHSFCTGSALPAELLSASKVKVTNVLTEKSVTVPVRTDEKARLSDKQRFTDKTHGPALFTLLEKASKSNPVELEISVVE